MFMRDEPLTIQNLSTSDSRILTLSGPLTIATLFEFQSLVRANTSPKLIIDFTNVPYVDSAGVGALVGAYVRSKRRPLHNLGGRE
jgi:anti-sigma B factor antagonist